MSHVRKEFPSGTVRYYIDASLRFYHRIDGPAVVYPDGDREWWIKGRSFVDNKSYQLAAGLSDEEMAVIILKYGSVQYK